MMRVSGVTIAATIGAGFDRKAPSPELLDRHQLHFDSPPASVDTAKATVISVCVVLSLTERTR